MSGGRIIIADASRITGAEFFTALTGIELPDPVAKQRRLGAYNRISAEERAKYQALRDAGLQDGEDTLAFAQRMWVAIDTTEAAIKARFAKWEREEADGLVEVEHLGDGRIAA